MSLHVQQSASQLLHEAFVSLRTLGKRSVLALLGIIIGSSSVVALINIGHNAAQEAAAIFKDMGTDTLVAQFPGSADLREPMPASLDTARLQALVPAVLYLAPLVLSSGSVIFQGHATNANWVGSTTQLAGAMRLKVREGRFLSDFDQGETYVVVGDRIARTLGSAGLPLRIGDRIRLNDYLFQVIGILHSQPPAVLIPVQTDDSLFLPLAGMRRIVDGPQISSVIARAAAEQNMETVASDLTGALKSTLRGREVEVQIPQQMIDGMTRQSRTFGYLLMALGGYFIGGRWRGGHECDADECVRTPTGDRYSHGAGGKTAGHSQPLPARSRDTDGGGRAVGGDPGGHCGVSLCPVVRLAVLPGRRLLAAGGRQHVAGGAVLRALSGHFRLTPATGGGTAR